MSRSTQRETTDDAAALVAQVLQGSLAPSVAAERLATSNAAITTPDIFSSAHHKPWAARVTTDSANQPVLEVDCCSAANVRLAQEILQQLQASILNYNSREIVAHPNDPNKACVRLSNCESFPALVDRLGWPPPQPLVDRWLKTLGTWENAFLKLGLPVDIGRVDELVIDQQAELAWPLLPFRVAQSMMARNSNMTQQPIADALINRWKPLRPAENSLVVLRQMTRLVAFNPDSSKPSAAAQEPAVITSASPPQTSKPSTPPKPSKPANKTRHKHRQTTAILLGLAVLIVALLALRTWNQPRSLAEKRTGSHPSASSPGAAGLFSDQVVELNPTEQHSSVSSQPNTELAQLATTAEVSLETIHGSTDSTSSVVDDLALTQLDFDPMTGPLAGPAVDPAMQGFAPETNDRPDTPDTPDTPDQPNTTAGPAPATPDNTPKLSTISLPERRDQEPFTISFDGPATPQNLILSFPGSTPWKLHVSGDSKDQAWIVDAKEQSEASAIATLEWIDQNGDAANSSVTSVRFQWTEQAANNPAVETLRNGRLSTPTGQTHYLRSPFTMTREAIRLTYESEFPLSPPPDSSCTTTSFAIVSLDPANPDKQLPIMRWLTPAETLKGRKLRTLVEFQLSEEAPVSVRSRIDLELGRQAALTAVSIATLDGGLTWFTITEDAVLDSLDRLSSMKTALAQRLSAVQRLYDNTSDSDRRRVIRNQREQLEQQEEALQQYSTRLVELQKLVGFVTTDLTLELTIITSWPDAEQSILQTAIKLE